MATMSRTDADWARFYLSVTWARMEFEERAHARGLVRRGFLQFVPGTATAPGTSIAAGPALATLSRMTEDEARVYCQAAAANAARFVTPELADVTEDDLFALWLEIREEFKPSHVVVIQHSGGQTERIEVRAGDRDAANDAIACAHGGGCPLYTREEWASETAADWEISGDGSLLFQGEEGGPYTDATVTLREIPRG